MAVLPGADTCRKYALPKLYAAGWEYDRIPSLAEQLHIVVHLDGLQTKVDSLKKPQSETAVELDALLPSILDRAFRGEL